MPSDEELAIAIVRFARDNATYCPYCGCEMDDEPHEVECLMAEWISREVSHV